MSGQWTDEQRILRTAWDFREDVLLLAAETAADRDGINADASVGKAGGEQQVV